MERAWGAPRYSPPAPYYNQLGNSLAGNDMGSAGTTAENENIAFDMAYVQYASPIGIWRVGYMPDGVWGTVFGDSEIPLGKVQWMLPVGPFMAIAYVGKFKEQSYMGKFPSNYVDTDIDMYVLAGNYTFKTSAVSGAAGLLYKFIFNKATRTSGSFPPNGARQYLHFLLPYAVVKAGPVTVQGEIIYGFGDYLDFDDPGTTSVDLNNLAAWLDATADFGMFYVGGSIAYISGDDPLTTDEVEGGVITGGTDWNPCLIMFNFDRYYWAGQIPGWGANVVMPNNNNTVLALGGNDGGMSNAYFFSGRAGVRPIADLDIMASVSYAKAVEKWAAGNVSGYTAVNDNDYGWEVDVTATYKITNNLSYMLGGGYLFTGDYFKGATTNDVKDNFLIINKLTLTF
jgi:hypothetical protein